MSKRLKVNKDGKVEVKKRLSNPFMEAFENHFSMASVFVDFGSPAIYNKWFETSWVIQETLRRKKVRRRVYN